MSFLTIARRSTKIALALCVLVSIQGCTEEEALETIGTIAIIGGAVAVGVVAANNPQPEPAPECGRHHHHGGYGSCRDRYHDGWDSRLDSTQNYSRSIDLNGNAVFAKMTADRKKADSTAQLAAHYKIPSTAAKILKNSLRSSLERHSLQPIYDLGLSRNDLENIASNQMISNVGINNISEKLGLTRMQTRQVIRKMMADAQQR